MKYLGLNKCWKKFATSCLKHAYMEGDFDCIYEPIFSTLCALTDRDENEVIVELRFAADMKNKYGKGWYRRSKK